MILNLNADKILNIHEGFEKQIEKYISEELERFVDYITRIDVYLTDDNGIKEGPNDIRCLLDAHIKGMQSVVITEKANSPEQAVHSASRKLKHAIESVVGRSRNRADPATFI